MAAAPQQGQGDNWAGILWGVAAIFATCGFIWYAFKTDIIVFYLNIKLYEVSFLTFFVSHFSSNPGYYDLVHQAISASLRAPDNVTFADLMLIGNAVGEWLRWPLAAILFIMALVVYFANTTRIYKHIYTMKDLARLEQSNWPQITPVIGLDLLKEDIDKGPWAMALSPMQFCKRHKLLHEVRPERREDMVRKDWDRIEVVLKRGEANKVFSLQLGPIWTGIEALPYYTKALFAIFAARINADSKVAEKMIRQISASSVGKMNMDGIDELLQKHLKSKDVQNIINNHAYVMTVMASMLLKARDDGVQASADFLWLKPLDRKLWYTLNTVGRQTPFPEVCGIFAHWIAEREAGRKLYVPMIEEATNALDVALKEIVYRPNEDE